MSGAAFVSGLSNHNKNGESLSYLQIDSSVNVSSTRRSVPKSFGDPGGGGGTLYDGLYGEAPSERGTFFRPQVYKRVGISQVEVYRRVGKSVI